MNVRDRVGGFLLAAALSWFAVPAGVLAEVESPDVPGTVQYLAIGAKNDANVATVVICTVVGYSDDMGITFLDSGGVAVCSLGQNDAWANNTYVFATQPVDAFGAFSVCGDPGPTITGGVVQMGGYTSVRCTAFLVDPSGTAPAFAVALQVYKAN